MDRVVDEALDARIEDLASLYPGLDGIVRAIVRRGGCGDRSRGGGDERGEGIWSESTIKGGGGRIRRSEWNSPYDERCRGGEILSGTYERITALTVSVEMHFNMPCSSARDIPNVDLPVPGPPLIRMSFGGSFSRSVGPVLK